MGSTLSTNTASETALSTEAIFRQRKKKADVTKEHPKLLDRLPSWNRFTSDDPHSFKEQARPSQRSSKILHFHRIRLCCRSEETKILDNHRDVVLTEESEITPIRSDIAEFHYGHTIDYDTTINDTAIGDINHDSQSIKRPSSPDRVIGMQAAATGHEIDFDSNSTRGSISATAAAHDIPPDFHGIVNDLEQLQPIPPEVTHNTIDDASYNDKSTVKTFAMNHRKQHNSNHLQALSSSSITDNDHAVNNNDGAVESSCNARRILLAIKNNRSTSKFGEPASWCTSMKTPSSSRATSTILVPHRTRRYQPHKMPQSTPYQPSIPRVFIANHRKVTMLDEHKKVFVIDLISHETCRHIRALTEDHLIRNKLCGGANVETWRMLYTYTKMDMPCNEVQSLASISNQIMRHIILIIGHVFGKPKAASKLKPRSSKEPHLLMYQKVDGKKEHTGVEMHYDGCAISFNLMLSDLNEYSGGGTYMRAMRKTVKLRMGQCLVHPGELYHCGVDIGSGTRFLMVGFLDGFDPMIIDESTEKDDRKAYQRNVVTI